MFRKAYVAATVLLILVMMAVAFTGCPQDVTAQYQVTVQNLTPLSTFEPVLTATHCNEVFVFREGEAGTADFVDFINGVDLDLVGVLDNLDAVTDLYLLENGLGLPTEPDDTAVFTLLGKPDDVITVVAPGIEDPFAGLDSVPLPFAGSRTFYMDSYVLDDGDVVIDILDANIVRVTVTRID